MQVLHFPVIVSQKWPNTENRASAPVLARPEINVLTEHECDGVSYDRISSGSSAGSSSGMNMLEGSWTSWTSNDNIQWQQSLSTKIPARAQVINSNCTDTATWVYSPNRRLTSIAVVEDKNLCLNAEQPSVPEVAEGLEDPDNMEGISGLVTGTSTLQNKPVAAVEIPKLPSIGQCLSILQKCREDKNLVKANQIHAQISMHGLEKVLGNYIVPMFVECGSLHDAQRAFDTLATPSEISWTSLIQGHIDCGQFEHAFEIYEKMQQNGIQTSSHTLTALIKACAQLKDLVRGRRLHVTVAKNGHEGDIFVSNSLISMYMKCGLILEAQNVFNKMPLRDVVSWTSQITGYTENRHYRMAIECFHQMQSKGMSPNIYTLTSIIKACSNLRDLGMGRGIHMDAVMKGLSEDLNVGNSLVDLYAKCGSTSESHQVFNRLESRDVVSWTAIIAGYAEHGPCDVAIELYEQMMLEGYLPNAVTYCCLLKAFGNMQCIHESQKLHMEVTLRGYDKDLSVSNSLISMYIKCLAPLEARHIFENLQVRDVVTWTAMIAGFVEHGSGNKALKCFKEMQLDGITPDLFTYAACLKACNSIGALDKGSEIHSILKERNLVKDIPLSNTLIDMYVKCGSIEEARAVFDKLPVRSTISWTSLMTGYVEHGPLVEVLRCFEQMKSEGISPNAITYATVLRACGCLGAIEKGRAIHVELEANELEHDIPVCNSLITMYGKCGSLREAEEVFIKMPVRDSATWSAMINGYGVNHESVKAIACFNNMLKHGMKPDVVTFTCILSACNHGSLVHDGLKLFKMMVNDYGIMATLEHRVCIVTLLGRSGHLYEAEMFLERFCCQSQETWAALLSACKTYGEEHLSMRCFQKLVEINAEVASWYVLMAGIFAGSSMWRYARNIEELRRYMDLSKKPASAFIEVNGQVEEFIVGNNQDEKVSDMLTTMNSYLKMDGHVPDVNLVVKPMMDKRKESLLCEHAEKLAIAFGLIHTPQGQTLRVTKSLRICNDCHDASKIISKVEKREIILRDDCSIHHFKDGLCSCGDSL